MNIKESEQLFIDFVNKLNNDKIEIDENTKVALNHIIKYYAITRQIDYPKNLLDELNINLDKLNEDQLAGLKYLMSIILSHKEYRVIELKFENGLNLTRIGEILKITKERVRQLHNTALHKLKFNLNRDYVLAGYNNLMTDIISRNTLCKSIQEIQKSIKELDEYKAQLDIYNKKYRKELSILSKEENSKLEKLYNSIVTKTDISINNLNISNRTKNSLKRSGIRKLSDFLKITELDLYKIRGLGEKCVNELKSELIKYNIEL